MRRSNHRFTTSEALRRVFLPSFHEASRTYTTLPILKRPTARPQCLSRPRPPPSPLCPPHPRHASTQGPMIQWQTYANTDPSNGRAFGPKDGRERHPRDEEITAYKIYMVRPPNDRLTEPLLLSEVLAARERDEKGHPTQFVEEVAPAGEERQYPVCKMIDKKAAREAEEAKRKANNKTKWQTKQLWVSWTVSDNDLGHRMARLKEWLGKGWRVEVVFGSKRKSGWGKRRVVSSEEADKVLEKIRNAVGEVEGAQERQMEGTVGEEAMMSFDGKAKK